MKRKSLPVLLLIIFSLLIGGCNLFEEPQEYCHYFIVAYNIKTDTIFTYLKPPSHELRYVIEIDSFYEDTILVDGEFYYSYMETKIKPEVVINSSLSNEHGYIFIRKYDTYSSICESKRFFKDTVYSIEF